MFLSDFGCGSPYVGQVHGVVEKLSGGRVRVVDLAHDLKSFSIAAGAYILYASVDYFPRGTVFLVVVDPGVGTAREPIAVETRDGYFLVGPNNGVLWPVIAKHGLGRAVVLDNDAFWLKPTSYTFHGRDIFAPAATMLALGVDIEALGSKIDLERLVKLDVVAVSRRGGSVCLKAVYIDRFGNVALSATRSEGVLEALCRGGFIRVCKGERCYEAACVHTFGEVEEGKLAVYYNSFGFVEVAVFMGSAAERLGVREGDEVCLAPVER